MNSVQNQNLSSQRNENTKDEDTWRTILAGWKYPTIAYGMGFMPFVNRDEGLYLQRKTFGDYRDYPFCCIFLPKTATYSGKNC